MHLMKPSLMARCANGHLVQNLFYFVWKLMHNSIIVCSLTLGSPSMTILIPVPCVWSVTIATLKSDQLNILHTASLKTEFSRTFYFLINSSLIGHLLWHCSQNVAEFQSILNHFEPNPRCKSLTVKSRRSSEEVQSYWSAWHWVASRCIMALNHTSWDLILNPDIKENLHSGD